MHFDIFNPDLLGKFINYVLTWIIIYIMFYVEKGTLKPRFNGIKNKTLYLIFQFIVTNTVVLYDLSFQDNLRHFSSLYRMFVLVFTFILYGFILYKDRFSKIAAISIIAMVLNISASYVTYYACFWVIGEKAVISASITSPFTLVYSGIQIIIMIVSAFFVIKFTKKIPSDVSDRYWIILSVMEFIFIIISCVLWDFQNSINFDSFYHVYSGFIMGFLLISSILAVYMFSEIAAFYTKEKQHYLLKNQNAALLQQLNIENTMNDNLRNFKHEINGLLTAIYVLAENKEFEETKRIISGKLHLLKDNEINIYTGNHMIDALLNLKIPEINKLNITLNTELAHLIVELPFSASDISSVLINLIENAIEASIKLQAEGIKPFIFLKICIYKNHLSIIIKNAFNGKLIFTEGQLTTNKSDLHLHGYGLKNVEGYAEQYNGIFRYTYTDNEFTAKVMLPL